MVYDPASKQLSLRDASRSNAVELADCPYCHRPLRDEGQDHEREGRQKSPPADVGYMNPSYFRMLHHSLPGSATSSRPPSPHGHSAQLSAQRPDIPLPPPAGAEFISSTPAPPPSSHGISSSAFSPNYFKTFFVEEAELGRGGKGVVLLVRHVLDGVSLGHFACKRVPVGHDHEWLKKVLVEVQLLQNLSHQNLVSYRHVWLEECQITTFGPSVPCAFILQQYCNAGDLHSYILKSVQSSTTKQQLKERMRRKSKGQPELPESLNGPRRMPFDEIFAFFKDITSGLNHLHTNGYIHRDLKPSNCLLHTTGPRNRVLVSDFGEVQLANAARNSTGSTGTISYCAPEVLRREPGGAFGNFSTKSDIFSLGMIVYFMCFGRLPYSAADTLHEENEDLDELRAEIAAWAGFDDERKVRADLPEQLYRFLKRLLSLDPGARPGTDEILLGIKAGSDLGELGGFARSALFEDVRPRISSASPSPAPGAHSAAARKPPGAPPGGLARHSSSKLRHAATAEEHRSPSPPMRREAEVGGGGAAPLLESSVVLSSRKTTNPIATPAAQPPSPPPMLMLPPPPPPTATSLPTWWPLANLLVRALVFATKYWTLMWQCDPYLPNSIVSMPLLCLAALEFGWLTSSESPRSYHVLRFVPVSLVAHYLAVQATVRWGYLCPSQGRF